MGERLETLRDPDSSIRRKLDAVASLSITLGIWGMIAVVFFAGIQLQGLRADLEEGGCMKAFESPYLDGHRYTKKNGRIIESEVVDNPFENGSTLKDSSNLSELYQEDRVK